MRIRVEAPGGARTWTVEAPEGTTLGALARLVGLPRASLVEVDGRTLPADRPVAATGTADGSSLAPARPTTVALALVPAGAPGGPRRPLAPGRHTIGRHPSVDLLVDDPAVGGLHAELDVDPPGLVHVRPRTPDAEPWTLAAGDELTVGTTRFAVVVDGPRTGPWAPQPTRTIHNRPPRATPPTAPVPPSAPEEPRAPSSVASARALVSLLVPSLAGVALSAVLRPDLVVFALLAPAGALVTWLVLRALDLHATRRHARAVEAHRAARRDTGAAHGAAVAAHLTARHAPPEEVARRVCAPDPRLWERRPAHDDFLVVAAGRGRVPVAGIDGEGTVDAPVELDLVHPIGIVGATEEVRSLTRAIVLQLAAHHGPADLALDAWTTDHFAWRWLHWLPHAGSPTVQAADVEPDVDLRSSPAAGARRLAVIDAGGVPARWRAAWLGLLEHGTALVLASHERELPEQCRTTVVVEGGRATVRDHGSRRVTVVHDPWWLDPARADELAARLARVQDPDASDQQVPGDPSLLALVAGPEVRDEAGACAAVRRRWAAARTSGVCVAPLGEDASGPVVLDLVADGPHALVAGTTGSGKSELLRALVLGSAASNDPQHLAFVLVDYKGGSAFDGLAPLPHVVDVVTDLDATGAARAVRGLEAEVLRRERALRAAGVTDIAALHRSGLGDESLPRLVVVVDEFATLAQELPAFVDALVDVAQRGRSLGVHLVLATQRPSGAVKDSIRTNTNLRIALRVVDVHDSRDVVGVDAAAVIGRRERGRAIVRLGAGELRTMQVAHTGRPVRPRCDAIAVAPFGMPTGHDTAGAPTELEVLVAAIRRAHAETGGPVPRRPWADPLPAALTLTDAHRAAARATTGRRVDAGWHLTLGLADDEDQQRHDACSWWPEEGNLLVAGLPASGTTDALAACIAGAAIGGAHVYVVSAMPGAFTWCAELASVGALIDTGDDERVRRLLATLGTEVGARRRGGGPPSHVPVLLLVDGVGVLRSIYDTAAGLEVLEQLERLAADGPAVGVHLACTAEHPGALGHRLDRTVARRVLLRLADRAELVAAGARAIDPASMPRGRGVDATRGALVQLAHLDDAARRTVLEADRAARARGRAPAPPIGALPDRVHGAQLPPAGVDARDVLHVPLGIGDHDLAPAGLALRTGAHALVLGAGGTGKSVLLHRMRGALAAGGITVVALGGGDPPGRGEAHDHDDLLRHVDALLAAPDRAVVLVDDADLAGGAALERLLAARAPHVHVVAAARGDRLRPLFRHWTSDLRRSGHAVLLRGDDADAELVGVRLPRRTGTWPAGRGWLVRDGEVQRCQFAVDDAASGS